jgi:hypothetical protein
MFVGTPDLWTTLNGIEVHSFKNQTTPLRQYIGNYFGTCCVHIQEHRLGVLPLTSFSSSFARLLRLG